MWGHGGTIISTRSSKNRFLHISGEIESLKKRFFFFCYPLLPAACFTEMYDEVSGTLLLRSFEWLSSYFSTASPSWVHAPPVIPCILDYDTGERICRLSQLFLSCLGSATNPVSYCCHNRVFIYLISLFGDFFFFSGDVSCCTSSNALLVTFWKAKGKNTTVN